MNYFRWCYRRDCVIFQFSFTLQKVEQYWMHTWAVKCWNAWIKYESSASPSKSACAALKKIPNKKRCAQKKKSRFHDKIEDPWGLAYTGKCNFITICFWEFLCCCDGGAGKFRLFIIHSILHVPPTPCSFS